MRSMFHSTPWIGVTSAAGSGSGMVKTVSAWISLTSFRLRIWSRTSGPLVTWMALTIQNDLWGRARVLRWEATPTWLRAATDVSAS